MDYASLREEGIRQLERLAGGSWTDFNVHDPGITILEQLCYALTDLGYRAGYELPDLLAGGGADPYASLHTPAQILSGGAVTVDDLRRLVIDVRGVNNAWIETVEPPVAVYDAEARELRYPATGGARELGPNAAEVRVKGLYRVSIERSAVADLDVTPLRRAVARRLHSARPLCTDFHEIRVLDQQLVRLSIALEIGASERAPVLLANVYGAIAAYLSPAVPFCTLEEMLARGRRADQIFDGPLLEHGFIDAEDLARVERRTTLRISDLIRELMSVRGVAAVKDLRFVGPEGQPVGDWLITVGDGKAARFDAENSDIRLERHGLRIDDAPLHTAARERFAAQARQAARRVPRPTRERDLQPPRGRDRKIAAYTPVQRQFPAVYGIGPGGLPASASPQRRAQAKQLRAYLLLYDQLLANHFAQLAAAATLFSFSDKTPDSYFCQLAEQSGELHDLELEDLRRLNEDGTAGVRRRSRFLDHLLARFGENFHDYTLLRPQADGAQPEERIAQHKRDFLSAYPRISRERGSAFDYLAPIGGPESNIAGLELALRRKLGVTEDAERFYLVEHILLRPLPGDAKQQGPLTRDLAGGDPYSLQLSLVFPGWEPRYQDDAFRDFAERTVREETPAHLTATVRWIEDPAAMQAFRDAHKTWLGRWRAYRLAELEA